MAFDIGEGLSSAGAAGAAGANPYFAAAFGIAGAFKKSKPSARKQYRWNQHTQAQVDRELAAYRGETFQKQAAAMGVHPMALIGHQGYSTSPQIISGQSNRGSRQKDSIATGLQNIAQSRALQSQINLQDSQARYWLAKARDIEKPDEPVQSQATAAAINEVLGAPTIESGNDKPTPRKVNAAVQHNMGNTGKAVRMTKRGERLLSSPFGFDWIVPAGMTDSSVTTEVAGEAFDWINSPGIIIHTLKRHLGITANQAKAELMKGKKHVQRLLSQKRKRTYNAL